MSAGDVERLAGLVRSARRVVALTGAGISVPSGIPDFRTPGTGIWANVDPMAVAHIDVLRYSPARFWSFYGMRFTTFGDLAPNPAHEALVTLERSGRLESVITQNIDGLHRKAGTRDLVEVHGTVEHSTCMACGERYALDEVRARWERDPDGIPRCECGGVIRPDVVLFGEYLPAAALAKAEHLAEAADLLLCVGSSLEVHPVADLPARTLRAGGRVALITQGPTPYDGVAAVKLRGDVADELPALLAAL